MNTSACDQKDFSGLCKLIEPYPWKERIHVSHGGENDPCKFYCTTYATTFGNTGAHYARRFTPLTNSGPDSGWTHEPVSQPHVVNCQLRREINAAEAAGAAQRDVTTHAASYMQPNIPPKTAFINDVYAGNNRPFYPAIGQEGLPRDLMRSFLPATEYQTNISTLPLKPWMATKLALGSPCFTDKQSAFLKGNTFHNYFVSPEIMESGQFGASSTGATVYQASFSGNSGTPQTSVRAGKRDKENHRTQYDGSQSMIHNEVALLPPKPEDDDVLSKRWETQNDSTYKWSGWKETEDARSAHRPLGPLQILTSGSTQNQSFLDIAQNI